jgi:yecA family protein
MLVEYYRTLDDWLVDQDADIRASEIQGLLAGLMASSEKIRPDEYVVQLSEYADLQAGKLVEISESLEVLFSRLSESWEGLGLDFELLLPADEELIEERVDALGAWCESFLTGLGLSGGFTKSQSMSEDTRQALNDLSEIARIELGEAEQGLEAAYVEISEHVRLAALLIATELKQRSVSVPDVDVMH